MNKIILVSEKKVVVNLIGGGGGVANEEHQGRQDHKYKVPVAGASMFSEIKAGQGSWNTEKLE